MNARRRVRASGLPDRVYAKHGSWFYVRRSDKKWILLCRIDEGKAKMVARLAEELHRIEACTGNGNMPTLIDEYVKYARAKHKDPSWNKYAEYAKHSLKDFNANQIDAAAVYDFLEMNWDGKLPMQRLMRSFLSGFFTWAVRRRHANLNPCRDVALDKPAPSKMYITDADFAEIRRWLMYEKGTDGKTGRPIPSGLMMQAFIDLCYLTMQRSTEIRMLKWGQIDKKAGVIHFLPTKTEGSSGLAVDWPVTPEIEAILERIKPPCDKVQKLEKLTDRYVIHQLTDGMPYAKNGVRSAWQRACKRAGLAEKKYTIKSIRAKAITDARHAGYSMEQIKVGAVHTDLKTTEGYIKQRSIPLAEIKLKLPLQCAG